MKKFILLIFIASTLVSCNQRPPQWTRAPYLARLDSLRNELLQTDISFSQLCETKGRNAAFIEYADSNATMLRPFHMPVMSRDSIISMFSNHPDSLYKLTWVPIRADVAHSAELGYTFGTYSLEIKDGGKEEGTYCTIWKKHKNQPWKFILDTGNEGLSEEDRK